MRITFVLVTLALTLLVGCSDSASLKYSTLQQNSQSQGQSLAPANPTVTPAPTPAPIPAVSYEALAWERSVTWTKSWSDYLYKVIPSIGSNLLNGSSDITDFCPNYASLEVHQKVNFWGMLVSAMAKYESGFDPLSRMQETTMGTDPITRLPVYSEGLLQLSYQDIQMEPSCQFDWSKDKNLSPTDPKKTILDPYKNLDCAIKILNRQVKKYNVIAAPAKYAYWAVLIPGGKYTQLTRIQGITKSLSFCQ